MGPTGVNKTGFTGNDIVPNTVRVMVCKFNLAVFCVGVYAWYGMLVTVKHCGLLCFVWTW